MTNEELDLTVRLRGDDNATSHEAAAEIERLRSENLSLLVRLKLVDESVVKAEFKRLNAEIERLRAELAELRQRVDVMERSFTELLNRKLAEKDREIERLREEAAWVRRKFRLPEDTPFADGSGLTLAGTLHVVESHAHGYERYIEDRQCDDKEGEIARQAAEIRLLKIDLLNERADGGKLLNEIEGLQAEVARMKPAYDAARGDIGWWCWQGDEYDHPESLTCPVLMSAEQARELVGDVKRLRGELVTLREFIQEHARSSMFHMDGTAAWRMAGSVGRGADIFSAIDAAEKSSG